MINSFSNDLHVIEFREHVRGRLPSLRPCSLLLRPDLQQMVRVEEAWWSVWEAQKLADFIPRSRKWKHGNPDVRLGDIVVFLRDGRKARVGSTPWRVGQVAELEFSDDGVARTAVLEYCNAGETGRRKTRRSVRSIAVLEREALADIGGQVATAGIKDSIHFICHRLR